MSAGRSLARETISEAERCGNTTRPLTRSTSTEPKEGLAVNATRICPDCTRSHSGSSNLCNPCRVARTALRNGDSRVCALDGCEKTLAATSTRKVCEMHYTRMRVHGSYDRPPAKPRQSDSPCAVDDCQKPAKSAGYCGMHRERVRNNGSPDVVRVVMGDPERRFWAKVDKTSGGPCWLWTGWCNGNGYGQFSENNGEKWAAHRWAYQRFVGVIPEGYEIDHVHARGCRHRHCVNPNHLEAVTPEENQRRMWQVNGLADYREIR